MMDCGNRRAASSKDRRDLSITKKIPNLSSPLKTQEVLPGVHASSSRPSRSSDLIWDLGREALFDAEREERRRRRLDLVEYQSSRFLYKSTPSSHRSARHLLSVYFSQGFQLEDHRLLRYSFFYTFVFAKLHSVAFDNMFLKTLTVLLSLAGAVTPYPSAKRADGEIKIYAYGTNISGLQLYGGNDGRRLSILSLSPCCLAAWC